MRKPRKTVAVALATVVTFYFSAYLYVRSKQWLVHRSGFTGGMTANHSVDIGNLGLGWNADYGAVQVSYWVFTPLRWGETAYWYLRHPAGKPWPY